jgi:pimeloyl-ACP methyl ester carboxylesterase
MKRLPTLLAGIAVLVCIGDRCGQAQDTVHEIQWPSEKLKLDFTLPTLIEVQASAAHGFLFPYYLYVPSGVRKNATVRLLVEPNNTGSTSDDIEVHKQSAKRLASKSYPRQIADRLRVPLLVSVFPRPHSQSEIYTHALDRDSLLVKNGPLLRIDLQLLAMIQDARNVLESLGISTKPKIFMDGFSASACFVNRFAALHPESVRALAAGGINGLPMFPLKSYDGVKLPFPLGVSDLKPLTGARFNNRAYREVSQFIYMGYLDRNDTFPFSDAWNDHERALIAKLFGREMMPDRWKRTQEIVSALHLPIETVTYNGVGHSIRPEIQDDIVAFLSANEGDIPTQIVPHQYPFVPSRDVYEAHIKAIYWKGDPSVRDDYAKFTGKRTIVISIEDQMDAGQLSEFVGEAGFEFDLVAAGHEKIHIGQKAFCGITTYNDGEFQGLYVCLDAELLNQIAVGVPYSLHPAKPSGTHFWSVRPDVVLLKRM